MPEKIVVGPVNQGIRTDRLPFNIDNDSFPTLVNAYQWRGRIKRKRGTTLLGRLQRFLGTTNGSGNLTVTIAPTPITSGIATFTVGTDVFVDPGGASPVTLLTNSTGSATLNRSTGVLTITGSQATTSIIYFPTLPVMGLEDFTSASNQFPLTVGFDTDYAYNIPVLFPYTPYDVSFYKNPQTGLASYVPKGTWTPVTWNGADYQQFWTTNYQGALWATNGINIPFSTTNIGMQFAGPTTTPALTAATRTSSTTMTFTVVGNPLVVGDFVFANEFTASAGGDATTLNFQTGYVTAQGNTFTVKFPNASIPAGTYTPGILQYLTNRSNTILDNIRWYDGDPTGGAPPTPSSSNGWVNFMPPLSQSNFSIAALPLGQYYLVGARMIVPFKDRLLFLGPVVQTSSGAPAYLQDTIIYSFNGTPYYTASFTGDPTLATTTQTPVLVPANQIANAAAYFEDVTGFGGNITAAIDQPINTVSSNEDVLLVGFDKVQSRVVYSGNDIIPFNFFLINSEYGSGSTFSAITFDKGAFTIGSRGIIVTTQTGAQRVDLEIPDQVFQFSLNNNGPQRITAGRDFINEWIYFTYSVYTDLPYKFPNQTLLYNYREQSWGIFNETYTTYGQFRRQSGLTWSALVLPFTWSEWNDPWNSGSDTLFQPDVIAGNQQGFVLFRKTDSTGEDNSLAIQNIVGNTVTSPNHTLNNGDYIVISGVLGPGASQVNGQIFSVALPDANTFMLNPSVSFGGTDYLGGGLIKRMYVPQIQTKQFPTAWGIARKTRIGPQQYLLSKTNLGQISLLIFLSQNSAGAYNNSPIVPDVNSVNNSLVYSTVLYTCPESTNLGLTPANINLQMVTASAQEQIWHRMNTSLIGDTVQIGFTLSDAQMRDTNFNNQFEEIELHGFILEVSPSQVLA